MPPCERCGLRHTIYADEMDCRERTDFGLTLDRWSESFYNDAIVKDRLQKYVR